MRFKRKHISALPVIVAGSESKRIVFIVPLAEGDAMKSSALAGKTEPMRRGSILRNWSLRADLGASYTVEMPVEVWINLADHPRRRDTERHARKADWDQLLEWPKDPCSKCCAGWRPVKWATRYGRLTVILGR